MKRLSSDTVATILTVWKQLVVVGQCKFISLLVAFVTMSMLFAQNGIAQQSLPEPTLILTATEQSIGTTFVSDNADSIPNHDSVHVGYLWQEELVSSYPNEHWECTMGAVHTLLSFDVSGVDFDVSHLVIEFTEDESDMIRFPSYALFLGIVDDEQPDYYTALANAAIDPTETTDPPRLIFEATNNSFFFDAFRAQLESNSQSVTLFLGANIPTSSADCDDGFGAYDTDVYEGVSAENPPRLLLWETQSVPATATPVPVAPPVVEPTAVPSATSETATISGELILPDGSTVSEAYITLVNFDMGDVPEVWYVDISGRNDYSAEIPSGRYEVCAYLIGTNVFGYACYDDFVVVGEGESQTGIDLYLEVGVLEAVVTDENGNGLEGIETWVLPIVDGAVDRQYAEWTMTDEDGSFQIVVNTNTYIVQFYDETLQYAGETYGGFPLELHNEDVIVGGYTPVEVTSEATTTITTTLAPSTQIAGTFESERQLLYSGDLQIFVSAYALNEETGQYFPAGGTRVQGDFSYSIHGLTAGTYRLCYSLRTRDDSYDSCYAGDGTPLNIDSRVDIVLGAGETITHDVVNNMTFDGMITGTVTDESGQPLSDIEVSIYNRWYVDEYDVVITDGNGQYVVDVPDGTHYVQFSDPTGEHVTFPYEGVTGSRVTIEDSATVTVDASLEVGGQIAGIVGLGFITNTSEAVTISVSSTNTENSYYKTISPDADGNYLFGGLPAGEYLLMGETWDGNYRNEYYEDSQFPADATLITVTPEETTAVDFVLDDAVRGGKITDTNIFFESTIDLWTGEAYLVVEGWIPESSVTVTYDSMCPGTTTAATLIATPAQDDIDAGKTVIAIAMNPNDDSTLNGTITLGDATWSGTITSDDLMGGLTFGIVTIEWHCGGEIITQSVGTLYRPLPTAVTLTQMGGTAASTATIATLIALLMLTTHVAIVRRKHELT